MRLRRWIWIVGLLVPTVSSRLDGRTWTEASTGRTLDGEFLEVDGEDVVIRPRDGRRVRIPLVRLTEKDRTFVRSAAGGNAETFQTVIPPVSLDVGSIQGEGDERKAEIELTNESDADIATVVMHIFYLREEGSVGKEVPHTHSGFAGNAGVLKPGHSESITIGSFFMEEDTTRMAAIVTSFADDEESRWPTWTGEPPEQVKGIPVIAKLEGILGEGDLARAVVGCFNHAAQGVTDLSYRIEYLDEAGETVHRTGYSYGSDRVMIAPGKGFALVGGDPPPEEAVDARVTVSRVGFADDSKWTPPE